jgi:L-fucose mutarotase
MLIGIPPILGPELLFSLRSMGHGDEIALVDANYPAQEHARRLVRADGLFLADLLSAILGVLPLDRAVPAPVLRAAQNNDPGQMAPIHSAIDALVRRLCPGITVQPLAGEALYPRIRSAHTVVATGERAPFANVILRKGVILPDGSPG